MHAHEFMCEGHIDGWKMCWGLFTFRESSCVEETLTCVKNMHDLLAKVKNLCEKCFRKGCKNVCKNM